MWKPRLREVELVAQSQQLSKSEVWLQSPGPWHGTTLGDTSSSGEKPCTGLHGLYPTELWGDGEGDRGLSIKRDSVSLLFRNDSFQIRNT